MKKFIASENIAIATSRKFKDSIELACSNTETSSQYITSRYEKTFAGTVVTFNTNTLEINCFEFKTDVDTTNKKELNKALSIFLKEINVIEKYKDNQFVTFIEASKFEYHGYIGYKSEREQELSKMKFENVFMSAYIDIITDNVEDVKFDNSPLLEEFNLSARTFNCLKRANINTYNELRVLTLDEISRVDNLGTDSLKEIEQVLKIKFL